jgi:hypothetical protein
VTGETQCNATYLVIGHNKIYEMLDKSVLREWLALDIMSARWVL